MSVPILLYHQIAPLPQKDMPFHGLLVHPVRFRSQMKWLKRAGYRGLSLRGALPYIKGEKAGKVAAITFDDGFLNVLENAAPILAEFGFTATNYLVANQVGGSNVWDQPLGVPKTPLMSAAQLREWAALGHEVGAHTLDHVHLTETPDNEARRQISLSKTVLENMLGEEVSSFCFPYGENNPIHREMAEEAGFKTATTTVRGRAGPANNLFELPRISIRRRDIWPKFLMRVCNS
ncbi:polysaccharide deacetylase [Ochrobactrum sp. P6BS-III]|uniref:polysaccharide deacetylase family protein n=1 Tax=unclassified Ochrobactrum TaxID=239106 RepID=UPI000991A37A|nr:peptidoglycan/xylan/chitin deacetylase (PgdA/CDA1 family) [Ochrobactrum sp. P6BSIII]OOL15711.1 polysaccharide deacetylase [Ochrobactrum sp. P6BS-III]